VANAFFGIQADKSGLKSAVVGQSTPSVEAITEQQSSDPSMYIINYPEGGWAIVSATRSYYPILAYSNESTFEQKEDMGPVEVWLTRTKEAIKESKMLDDSIKTEIYSIWNDFEIGFKSNQALNNLKSADPLQDALSRRMSQLGSIYGYPYIYTTLAGARNYFPSESDWQSVCNWANAQGSPPAYTIFVGKNEYYTPKVGPLFSDLMKWHQGSPFNDLVSGSDAAGCSAIAVAQLMRYYQYPQSFNWNGYAFNWSNIPLEPTSGSDQAALVRLVGQFLNVHYGSQSWTTPNAMEDGVRNLGFTVSRVNHYYNTVRTQLFSYQRPVIMLGGATLNLFDPLTYIGNSHYWVCDGVSEYEQKISFFIDLINTSNYTYYNNPYIYNPGNPFSNHMSQVNYLSMKWGWQYGPYDAWYIIGDGQLSI
jgi:hypothetical protein